MAEIVTSTGVTIVAKRKPPRPQQVALNVLLIVLFILGLYPLFMALVSAFKSGDQYLLNKYLISLPLRLENVGTAFVRTYGYMLRTVIVAVATTVFMLIVSSMSGFAIAKLDFPGSKLLFVVILGVNMLPGVMTLVPTFTLYHNLGLADNLLALIIPGTFSTSTAFLMISSFRGLPNSIFEAAEIDGANDFQKYLLIGMPLCMPILATLCIMQFSGTFSDFGWPMLIMTRKNYTVAAGLKVEFSSAATVESIPISFAAYLIASIPLIILFFFTNRFYVEGIVASGLKL